MRTQWKVAMVLALAIIFIGFGIAIEGILEDHHHEAYAGLGIIAIVCVSWWFWVMFIIRTMIQTTDRTLRGIHEIKYDLREVRGLVQDIKSCDER